MKRFFSLVLGLVALFNPRGVSGADTTPPTISLSAPSTAATANGPVSYTVTYADAQFNASTLAVGNITLNKTGTANGIVSVSAGSGTTRTVTISSIAGNGSLGISIAAGTAIDTSGNMAPASGPSATFVVDKIPPTTTLSLPSVPFISSGPVTYTVTFSDAHFKSSTLSAANVSLNWLGPSPTGHATVSVPPGSGTTRTIILSGITGDGLLDLTLGGNFATDTAGNIASNPPQPSPSPISGTPFLVVDNTPPRISEISAASGVVFGVGQKMDFQVQFGETLILDTSAGSPQLTLTIGSSQAVANFVSYKDPQYGGNVMLFRYVIQAGDADLDGVVVNSPMILNGSTIRDQAGNNAILTFSSQTAGIDLGGIIDTTAPTISLSAPSTNVTKAGPVSYAVRYADANFKSNLLTAANIALNKTGTANGTVAVAGSGTNCTVTITGITGTGTLGISVAAGTAIDKGANTAPAAGPSATFAVDNTPPAVSVSGPSAAVTTGGPVSYTVTYSDANFNASTLTAANITLNKTGTANGTVTVTGSGLTWTVTISGNTGSGSLGISVAAGTATDTLGNLAPASAASTTFIVNNSSPIISGVGSTTGRYGAGKNLDFAVTFDQPVIVTGSPKLQFTIFGVARQANFLSASGSVVTFRYTILAGENGLVEVVSPLLLSGGTIKNASGNNAGLTFTLPPPLAVVDTISPTLRFGGTSRSADAVLIGVAGDSDIADYAIPDSQKIIINRTGTANGTTTILGGGSHFAISISNLTGDGTLSISFAAGAIFDMAGNPSLPTGQIFQFSIDNSVPAIVSIAGPSNAIYPTGRPLDFLVTFSEPVIVNNAGGSPLLSLTIGSSPVNATYVAGSGTSTLQFHYEVQAADSDLDGIGLNSPLILNGSTIQDAAGHDAFLTFSLPDTSGVLVSTGPIAPTLGGNTLAGPYTEGGPALAINSDVTVADPDNHNMAGASMTFGNHLADDVLSFTDQLGITGNFDSVTGVLTLFGTSSTANYQAALRSVTYNNAGHDPTVGGTFGTRVVFTTITDDTGLQSAPKTSEFTIVAINDAPVLSGLGDPTFDENVVNATPQIIDSAVSLTDLDSPNFNGGNLTVSYYSGGGPEDQLSIVNQGTDPGQIGFSGGSVTYGGAAIGTVPGSGDGSGQNGADLIVTFTTTNATLAAVTALIQNLTYANSSDTPALNRTLQITVDDGGGSASSPVFSSITVNPSNDQPTLDAIAISPFVSGNSALQSLVLTGISAGAGDIGQFLTITATSSDTSIVANPTVLYNSPASTATVQFSPVPGANGTALITVTVQDDGGTANAGVDTVTGSFSVTVDSQIPFVTDVTSPTADGTYGSGDSISIQVMFSENVIVTGTPQLTLATGISNRTIDYVSGSGSSALIFTYNIHDDDLAADLDYISSTAFGLNGGAIQDGSGNDAVLALPAPGTAGSLGANKDLAVDGTVLWVGYGTPGTTALASKFGFAGVPLLTYSARSDPEGIILGSGANAGSLFVGESPFITQLNTSSGALSGFAFLDSGVQPEGLVFDTAGNLYIANPSGSGAPIYVLGSGAAGGQASALSISGATLSVPTGLTIDSKGNLYAADASLNQIIKINISSGVSTVFASVDSNPHGVAFDRAGNLYVANSTSGTVSQITPGGGVSTFASGLNNPIGIAFDRAGNLYVANNGDGTVSKFSPAGQQINAAFISGLDSPRYIVSAALPPPVLGPTVLSIVAAGSNPANGASVLFTVTFSSDVTGVDAADFALTTTGVLGASVTSVTGSGAIYTVTVDTGSGDGTIRLDVSDDDSILDGSNRPLGEAGPGNGNFNSGDVYTIDKTAPDAPVITGISSDTGQSATDLLTAAASQLLIGTAEPLSVVSLSETGVGSIGTATVDGTGNWTFDNSATTLAPGVHIFTARATDATGNASVISGALTVTIDTTPPTITSIVPPSNGSYGPSANLDFTLTFSEPVFFDITGGTPFFNIDVGGTPRTAGYFSGSGTSNIVFRSSVQAGDTDSDGIEISSPVVLNSGIIEDAAGNAIGPAFTPPDTSRILVDTTAPTLLGVSAPPNATYGTGDALDFTVTYNENVLVGTAGGTPQIGLAVGSTSRQAIYISGSGTSALVFRHTVVAGDLDADGIASIAPLDLNGGTMTDLAGNIAPLTFTLPDTSGVKVNALAPGITSATPPPNGSYRAGQNLDFNLGFSESVTASGGIPSITVTVGSTARTAALFAGSGSSTLTFRYTVQAGETDADGVVLSSPIVLHGATIRNGTSQDATLAFAAPSTPLVRVDTTAPTISSVSSPSPWSYAAGQNLSFVVNYSESVSVTGVPQIGLIIGSAAHTASYVSGSGSTALVFQYTVLAGDNDNNGITSSSPIALNGGTIQDAAGNNAILTFTPPTTTTVLVDTTAPTIASVTGPANGSYRAGQVLNFTVNFSESVTAIGVPTISLVIGATPRIAVYFSGSGSSALLFRYTVQGGETDSDGIASSSPVVVIVGTIIDAAGNNATLTFTPPNTTGVLVDTTAPSITSVTAPGNATYNGGQNLDFTVNYNEIVTVNTVGGIPRIGLTIGSTARTANYLSGSGSSSLVFRYTVQSGEFDNNGIDSPSSVVLNGGTIQDVAGNAALLTFVPPTTTGVLVDATAPNITSVTGPAPGQYRAGQFLDFTVTYNSAVTVTGTPQIGLVVGSTARTASFLSATSPTVLVFRHVVVAGDTDANGITSASPVTLNGGTIKNAVNVNANPTFPPPNTAAVLVDTTAPSVAVSPPSSALTKSGPITYTVTYADANFNTSTLAVADITLNKTGTANGSVTVSGNGTTRTVAVSNITGDGALGISIAAGTAIDLAGNSAPSTGASGTFTVDNTAPTVTISAPSSSITRGGPITYTVTYADPNFSSSTLASGKIILNKTGTANGSVAVAGTGPTRTVTVSSVTGDGTLGISVAAGTATDTSANSSAAAGPSATFAVDNTPPTINISSPSANITGAGAVSYIVTYADANFNSSTLAASALTLNKTGSANASVAVSGSGTVRTVTLSGISGNGTLGISVASGTASDIAGNLAPAAGPGATFVVDNTPPAIILSGPSSSITAHGPVSYTVTYGDANFNASTLSASDITLNKTSTANGSVAISGSGSARTVTISGISGNGSLGISIASGTASDTSGNLAPATGPGATFVVDNTPPTIILGGPSASLTGSGPVSYTVTFADANFSSSTLSTANISLNKTGTANGSVSVSGSGSSRTVTISSITGNGALGISVGLGTAVDLAGNFAPGAGPSATFAVDNAPPLAPTFTAITTDTGLSSTDQITSDNTLALSGTAEANSTVTLTRSGASVIGTCFANGNGAWNFDYTSTVLADGNYTFTATTTDSAGNTSPASSPFSVTIDTTSPNISFVLAPANDAYRAGQNLDFTAIFSEKVIVDTSGGIPILGLVVGSNARNATYISGSGSNALLFRYTVQPGETDLDGIEVISPLVLAGATMKDVSGNNSNPALALPKTAGVLVDTTPPTISLSGPSANLTSTTPITYTVTYADANFHTSSLGIADITLIRTGTANGVLSLSGGGTTRTITIAGFTGDGTLGLSIAAGTASDLAGNLAPAIVSSAVFSVDTTPPLVSISGPSVAVGNGGLVSYNISYSDVNLSAISLSSADITLNRTGTANGTIDVSGSGSTRTVTVSNLAGDGSMSISVAAGTARDIVGNLAPSAGPSAAFVQAKPPSIFITPPSTSLTRTGPVTFAITDSAPNFDASTLSISDITLKRTSTANGTVSVSGDGTTRMVTISNIHGDGTLGIDIAAGTARYTTGQLAPAVSSSPFTIDNTPPEIALPGLMHPSTNITSRGPVIYTLLYTEANFNGSSLASSDITLNKTGTASGVVSVSGEGDIRFVTISNIIGDGSLGISIAAGTAVDQVGLSAGAFGPSATFIVDNTAPAVSISAPSATNSTDGPVSYSITYADANFDTSTLSLADISLNKTGTASGTVAISGSGAVRTVTISGLTGNGTLGIALAAGTGRDTVGNLAPAAGPSIPFTVERPAIGIPSIVGGVVRITITGIPGRSYIVQSADLFSGPFQIWVSRATVIANEFGVATFEDTSPSSSVRIYRTITPGG